MLDVAIQFSAKDKEFFEAFFDEKELKEFYSSCEGNDSNDSIKKLKDTCKEKGVIGVDRRWGKEKFLKHLQCIKE